MVPPTPKRMVWRVTEAPWSLWAEETLFLPVYTFFWGGLFSSPTLFAATGQQPTCSWVPFSAKQSTFSFSFWGAYGFICGWPRPVSSRSAKQPGWRSPPIVTIRKDSFHIQSQRTGSLLFFSSFFLVWSQAFSKLPLRCPRIYSDVTLPYLILCSDGDCYDIRNQL